MLKFIFPLNKEFIEYRLAQSGIDAIFIPGDTTNASAQQHVNNQNADYISEADAEEEAAYQAQQLIAARALESFNDDALIRVFFEGCQVWCEQNQAFTDVSEIRALWESYLETLSEQLKPRAKALTSTALNEPQILPNNYAFIDALKAQLLLSVPDMLYYQYLGFYPRGRRPDELVGRVNITRTIDGKITFTADKNAAKEKFENTVSASVFAPGKLNPFESFLKYTHSMSDLDQEGTYQCICAYIVLFEKILLDLRADNDFMKVLRASTASRKELMQVLNMTCNHYLSYYLLEHGGAVKHDFCKVIIPIFQQLEEGFDADLNVSIDDAAEQYIKNFKYNCNLCIFDAITPEDRRRQQAIYKIAHYRNMGKDEASAMLEVSGYGPETDANELVANEFSMRASTFTSAPTDALTQASLDGPESVALEAADLAVSEKVSEEVFNAAADVFDVNPMFSSVEAGVTDEELITHLFEKNILYLRDYDREKYGDTQCQIGLHRLWDAYVADAQCPAWIKDNNEVKTRLREKISPDNQLLQALLTKEKEKDKTFFSDIKAIHSNTLSNGITYALADEMQAAAILWMYPSILGKVAPGNSRAFEGLLAREPIRRARLTCEWIQKNNLTLKITQYYQYQENEAALQMNFDKAGRARAMRTFIPLLLETRDKAAGVYAVYNDVHLDLMIVDKRLLKIFDSIEGRLIDGDWAEKDLLSILFEMISIVAKDFHTIFRPATLFRSIAENYTDIEGNPVEKGNKLLLMTMVGYLQILVDRYAKTSNKLNNQYCSVLLAALTDFLKSAADNNAVIASDDFYKDFAKYMTATFQDLLAEKDPRQLGKAKFASSYNCIGITAVPTLIEKVLISAANDSIPLSSPAALNAYSELLHRAAAEADSERLNELADLFSEDALFAPRDSYEIRLTTAARNNESLPSFFDDQGIQEYLLEQIEGLGDFGAKTAMQAILHNVLPLHEKLRLLAAIAEGKDARGNFLLPTKARTFYKNLKAFSNIKTAEEVPKAFRDFLIASEKIDKSVTDVERYIQRNTFILLGLQAIPESNFSDDFPIHGRLKSIQPFSESPLHVFDKINELQEMYGPLKNQFITAISRSAPDENSLSFSSFLKYWISYAIDAKQLVVEDLISIGVLPRSGEIAACCQLLQKNKEALEEITSVDSLGNTETTYSTFVTALANAVIALTEGNQKELFDVADAEEKNGKPAAAMDVLSEMFYQVTRTKSKKHLSILTNAVIKSNPKVVSSNISSVEEGSIIRDYFSQKNVAEPVSASFSQIIVPNKDESDSSLEQSDLDDKSKLIIVEEPEERVDDQFIRDYLRKQLERPEFHAIYRGTTIVFREGITSGKEVDNGNDIRDMLNSDLTLHQQLLFIGEIGRGMDNKDTRFSQYAPMVQKFYQGLRVFVGVEKENIVLAFMKFLMATAVTEKDVAQCFELALEHLYKQHEWMLGDFLTYCFRSASENSNLFELVVNAVTKVILAFPVADMRLNDQDSIKAKLVTMLAFFLSDAAKTGNVSQLAVLSKAISEAKADLASQNIPGAQAKTKSKKPKKKVGFGDDATSKIDYTQIYAVEADEPLKKPLDELPEDYVFEALTPESMKVKVDKHSDKAFRGARSEASKPIKSTVQEIKRYETNKKRLIQSLSVDNRTYGVIFDSIQIKEYFIEQLPALDISEGEKSAIKNVLASRLAWPQRLRLIAGITSGICEQADFFSRSEETQSFCKGVQCFSKAEDNSIAAVASATNSSSLFSEFMVVQGMITEGEIFETHIQRYMLIQQGLTLIPADRFSGEMRKKFESWCGSSVFENPTTLPEDIKRFQEFLKENFAEIQGAISANNLMTSPDTAGLFVKLYPCWVRFSVRNNIPLKSEDIALIGVLPTTQDIEMCRIAIQNMANLSEEQKSTFSMQISTFEEKFQDCVGDARQTGEVITPVIKVIPTKTELRSCYALTQNTFKLPLAPVNASTLNADSSSSSTEAPAVQELPKVVQQNNAFTAVLKKTCIENFRNGAALWENVIAEPVAIAVTDSQKEQSTLLELLEQYKTLSSSAEESTAGPAAEKDLTVKKSNFALEVMKFCTDDEVLQLKAVLEKFKTATGTSLFFKESVPTGMREVIKLINENDPKVPTVDILLKLKSVAEKRGVSNSFGREQETIDAYKLINKFFSSGPRTATIAEASASASEPNVMKMRDLIGGLNDIHVEAKNKAMDARNAAQTALKDTQRIDSRMANRI